MAKRKLARKKSKVAKRLVARKHVAHRKVAKRVVRKQVRRAAPKKQDKSVLQFGSAAKPVDQGRVADQAPPPPPAGAHLDAPSAAMHPGAGQSSGAVKSDSRVLQ